MKPQGLLLFPQVLTNHCPDQMNLVIVLNLLRTRTCGLHVGRCLPQTVSLLGPAPTLSPSFWLAQVIFKLNIFPYKYSNILNPSHSSYLPAYEDETQCSKTLAYKIQTPGNYPELPRRKHTTSF
jgi:hypothetical protein